MPRAAVGTVAGAWAGDYFFNHHKAKPDPQANGEGAKAAHAR